MHKSSAVLYQSLHLGGSDYQTLVKCNKVPTINNGDSLTLHPTGVKRIVKEHRSFKVVNYANRPSHQLSNVMMGAGILSKS